MKINKLTVENYKGFNSAQSITLGPGINIITGQNNSGKTSLLEALTLRFSSKPHKSSTSVPSTQSLIINDSVVKVELSITFSELKELIYHLSEFRVPILNSIDHQNLNETNIIETYFNDEVIISLSIFNGHLRESKFLNIRGDISREANWRYSVNSFSKRIQFNGSIAGNDSSSEIAPYLIQRIYSFKAERFNISTSLNFATSELVNDAQNLPDVLNQLHSNPIRFERYNNKVRLVFPQIFRVTPISIGGNQVQLNVWVEDPINERTDLTIPLNECGTGLSQVLSILYVVMNANFSRVIIIDEPNSFLHPGASRKLIEILKEYTDHQFIITTHSTSTIAAAQPKTIHLLKNKETETIIESIDIQDTKNQQVFLTEIGSKLSDVFGADNILWVEGKTEEICFPKIIDKIEGVSLMGTVILSVINTGDFFNKKNPKLVLDVYKKLSAGKGLMPPALGFVFDSEKLSEKTKTDLYKDSSGLIHFIPRTTFENYLLNPCAIEYVINSEVSEFGINQQQIENWLEEKKWHSKYIGSKYFASRNELEWYAFVDGAKLLADLFSELTQTKLSFNKIKHSVALCDWIIENSFDDLSEIQSLLISLLKQK